MPAYNGIRGHWNEVRVNSNYKGKNAVPQGTELEAGMQTKMEKSRYDRIDCSNALCIWSWM